MPDTPGDIQEELNQFKHKYEISYENIPLKIAQEPEIAV